MVALMLIFLGHGLMGAETVWAQPETHGEAHGEGAGTWALFGDQGLKGLGIGIGAGIVVLGGAAGVGKVGATAVESMARQPEAAGTINIAMLITAAMIEGATLFGIVVCMLIMILFK
jgi:F-type H+-transporting ATPase subunit c